MWYLINSLKLVSENPKIPPWKNPLPLFTQSASPLFLPTLKIFQAPRQKAGGGGWGGEGGAVWVCTVCYTYWLMHFNMTFDKKPGNTWT